MFDWFIIDKLLLKLLKVPILSYSALTETNSQIHFKIRVDCNIVPHR